MDFPIVGKGSFADVVLLNKDEVLKRSHAHTCPASVNEQLCLSQLDSPYIIKLLRQDEHGIYLPRYHTSYYAEISQRRLSRAQRIEVIWRIANAIRDLNQAGWMHRDLKPENIVLNRASDAVLIDLGHACEIGTYEVDEHTPFEFGSPAWLAPEVHQGTEYSEKIDIWSLGIILVESLTDVLYTDCDGLDEIDFECLMSEVIEKLPERYRELASGMLHVDPNQRWNIEQVLEHLAIIMLREKCLSL